MFLVLKNKNGKDIGIDANGTEQADLRQAELFGRRAAQEVAAKFGGKVVAESRVFGDDLDDDDWQE